MIVQQALFEGRSVSVALPPIRVLFPLRAPRVIPAPSAFLPSPLNSVNSVNPVKNQPVPPPPLTHRVSDTMAVRQNTMRKSTFLPERGRPARLPQGRCRMPCPIFGRDALLRVRHRRRCGILPRRFRGCWVASASGRMELGRTGGFSRKAHKASQRKCAACAERCTMVP